MLAAAKGHPISCRSGLIKEGDKTDLILLRTEDLAPVRGVSSILLHGSSVHVVGLIKKGKVQFLTTSETSNQLIPSAVYNPIDLRYLSLKTSFSR